MVKAVHFGGFVEEEETEGPTNSGFVLTYKHLRLIKKITCWSDDLMFTNISIAKKVVFFSRKRAKRSLESDLAAIRRKSTPRARRTPKTASQSKQKPAGKNKTYVLSYIVLNWYDISDVLLNLGTAAVVTWWIYLPLALIRLSRSWMVTRLEILY